MKKLILKSQLSDRTKFDAKLAHIGMTLSPAVWQHERIYVARDYRPRMNFPRMILRTEVADPRQPASYTLRLKRHIEDSGIDWVNTTFVSDYTEASHIIHQLGYRKLTEISRQRQSLILDDRTAIYLDTLENSPFPFLKIEAELVDGTPVEAMRRELFTTLSLLGQDTFLMQSYADLTTGEQMQPYFLPS